MLERLEIKKYQCHYDTVMEFVPGMNVITGASDKGKSASFRAMLWGLRNRPSGGAFRHWGTKDTEPIEVAFEFKNATGESWFVKSRVKDKNKYTTEAGDYEALRSDVPDQIKEISQIEEYNIQTQHQPYFMLQDTEGDRAKRLNKLVGLDIIDRVFKRMNGRIMNLKQEITKTTANISSLEAKVAEMNEVLVAESLIEKLSNDIDKHTKTVGKCGSLREIISKLSTYDAQIEKQSAILLAESAFAALQVKQVEHQVARTKSQTLKTLTTSLKKFQEDIDGDTEWLLVEQPYLALKQKIADASELRSKLSKLKTSLGNVSQFDSQIDYGTKQIAVLINKYAGMLKEGGFCPICMSDVDIDTAEHIIKKLKG